MNIEIEMENGGIIKAELYPDVAPITVENFVSLIERNFFDGLIFHRVIPGFMIQGGGFTADGHTRGVLSMARTMFPNSASSQFFIMHEDAPHLDGQYAAFGKVTEGIEVVDEIAETPTNMQDKPIEDQIIKTIRLV